MLVENGTKPSGHKESGWERLPKNWLSGRDLVTLVLCEGVKFPFRHGLHWSLQIIDNQLLARVMYGIAPSPWR